MKRLSTLIMFVLIALAILAQKKQISNIEKSGQCYYVYDEKGTKLTTLFKSSIGEIKGWGNDFFIAQRGGSYVICDAKGKTQKSLSVQMVGEIIAVSGDTFTSKSGNFILTFDKTGKKLNARGK